MLEGVVGFLPKYFRNDLFSRIKYSTTCGKPSVT